MSERSCILIMGVCGCGKTTIGQLLAERIEGVFLDADDLHPPQNVKKMAAGHPLNDEDRWPWLDLLKRAIHDHQGDQILVVGCSALKEAYRQRIGAGTYHLVYLKGTQEEILPRIQSRKGHFMPAELLSSQFSDLEEPTEALIVSITPTPDEIVQFIVDNLHL